MKFRTHKTSTNVVYGITLSAFTTVVFFLMNAGIDPRPNRYGEFDPTGAATVGIGLFGLYHAIAIMFFDEDDSSPTAEPTPDHHVPRVPDSYTGFIRQSWYKVFSVGPIWAFFSAASIFVWHAFAENTGTPGSVWGDYATSPLPAFAIFFACWTATNLGFALSAVAEALNRDHPRLFATTLVAMFLIGIGGALVFFMLFLPDLAAARALAIFAIALPLSLLALFAARMWAVARVARYDAANPHLSPRERRRREMFDPLHRASASRQASAGRRAGAGRRADARQRSGAVPPYDLLEPGETLLLHYRSDRATEPQMLIATNRRFIRASIIWPDRTYVLEQASPGQLCGARSEHHGPDLVTIASFRDRQDMAVLGGDPVESQRFAEAVNLLARTGRLPH